MDGYKLPSPLLSQESVTKHTVSDNKKIPACSVKVNNAMERSLRYSLRNPFESINAQREDLAWVSSVWRSERGRGRGQPTLPTVLLSCLFLLALKQTHPTQGWMDPKGEQNLGRLDASRSHRLCFKALFITLYILEVGSSTFWSSTFCRQSKRDEE